MKNGNKMLFTMAFAAMSLFAGSVKAEENACVENSKIGFEQCAPVVDDK